MIILCTLCVAAGAEEKAAPKRIVDGSTTLYNGNHNFLLSFYGGVQYFGDFQSTEGLCGLAGAEVVYNYFGLRTSLGGNWGSKDSSSAQLGVYWNFIQNPNRKHRAYIGATAGFTQYAGILNSNLLLTGEELNLTSITKIKFNLPPNEIAPQVGLRLGVDWRLANRLYLTTAVEGLHSFVNKNITFADVSGSMLVKNEQTGEFSEGEFKLTPSDTPVPIHRWGAKILIGLTIRLK